MKKHCWSRLAIFSVLAGTLACHTRAPRVDAGSPAFPITASDAGPPRVLQLRLEVKAPDGGLVSEVLALSSAPSIPVTQALDVTANLPLHNYRLRLFDEVDRALASDDVPEEAAAGLRYHIVLLAPLRPGHRYTVLLDAQSGATLDDGSGTAIDEQRFEFHTEGEREKEPVKRSSSKRRHRRSEGP
jgi:hypothetical protein